MHEFTFEAIGTHWKILIADTFSGEQSSELLHKIRERINIFDRDYSRFRADSLVTKMSRDAGIYALPKDAEPMLDLYRELYDTTQGLFTPLVGQMLSDAGYDASYSLKPKSLIAPPGWDEALAYNFPKLEIKKPALLDFGAAGKGYLVDIIAQIIEDAGVESFSVNAGGDICVRDKKGVPMRIGLEHPEDTALAIGVAEISNQSICGSAGNRRAWGEYHHIMNPHTLASVRAVSAVWVVAQTTMLADALATCLFFVTPFTLSSRYAFQYLMMYSDSSVERSAQFPAELFTTA